MGQDNSVPKWAQHMTAYGCSGDGGSLCTSLNMTAMNLFGVTHIDSQRLHLSWYCFPFGLRNGQMRAPLHLHTFLGLRSYSSNSWVVRLEKVAATTHFLLGRNRPTDTDKSDWATAPWRRSYRPFTFEPATAPLFAEDLWHPVNWPQPSSGLLPVSENWPTTIEANSEKNGKTS